MSDGVDTSGNSEFRQNRVKKLLARKTPYDRPDPNLFFEPILTEKTVGRKFRRSPFQLIVIAYDHLIRGRVFLH